MSDHRVLEDLLRDVAILAEATPEVIDAIASAADMQFVAAGDYLFRQGDPAEGLVIVASGRLDTYFDGDPPTFAGTSGHGDVIGELALLSASTRGASVRARRDSVVYQIRRGPFEGVIEQQPEVALAIARNLSQRLRQSTPREVRQQQPRVFVVTSVDGDKPMREFVDEFSRALGATHDTIADASAVPHTDEAARAEWLDRAETSGAAVVLLGDGRDRGWFDFCLRSADRVLLVSRGRPDPALHADTRLRNRDLLLLDGPLSRARLHECLDFFRPARHYFIGAGTGAASGIAHAARRMTGRSVGLVLSGGGARGLAHIGVIEGLLESGVTIDRIGGCSMGALVGSMMALEWPVQRMITVARDELVRQKPFSDYRLSRVSLIKAKRATAMLERILGDVAIEELERRLFTVSSDLVSGELVVHRRGPLLEAVGASMSIPGLVPPHQYQGRWLVDGGVLNNLPVDVMARDAEGPIIAVDVMRGAGPVGTRGTAPSMLDTVVRSTLIGGWERNAGNRRVADVLIAPEVVNIGLLDFDRLDDAVSAGRAAAALALDEVSALGKAVGL